MNNTITISLCEEDRKRIDELIGAVSLLASVIGSTLPPKLTAESVANLTAGVAPAPVAEPDPTAVANPAPIIEETPAPVAETTEEVKPVSLAEFQKAVTLAVSKGAEAKKAVKAIINKYAASVSAVPEDKRAEVMAELATI